MENQTDSYADPTAYKKALNMLKKGSAKQKAAESANFVGGKVLAKKKNPTSRATHDRYPKNNLVTGTASDIHPDEDPLKETSQINLDQKLHSPPVERFSSQGGDDLSGPVGKGRPEILSNHKSLSTTNFGSSNHNGAGGKTAHFVSPQLLNPDLQSNDLPLSGGYQYRHYRIKSGVERIHQNPIAAQMQKFQGGGLTQNKRNYQNTFSKTSSIQVQSQLMTQNAKRRPGDNSMYPQSIPAGRGGILAMSGDSNHMGTYFKAGPVKKLYQSGTGLTNLGKKKQQPGMPTPIRVLDPVNEKGKTGTNFHPASAVNKQPMKRPKTTGKPGGRRVNFQEQEVQDNRPRFLQDQKGVAKSIAEKRGIASGGGLHLSSKQGSSFFDQVGSDYPADAQNLMNQKSQPIITKKAGKKDFSSKNEAASRGVFDTMTNTHVYSSGCQLINSSQGMVSSNSPKRGAAFHTGGNVSKITRGDKEQPVNINIVGDDQFHQSNFRSDALSSSQALDKQALNHYSGVMHSRNSARSSTEEPLNFQKDITSFHQTPHDASRTFNYSQNNESLSNYVSGRRIVFEPRQKINKTHRRVEEKHLLSQKRYKGSAYFNQLSQPKGLRKDQTLQEERKLALYKDRVLIDRESTHRLEQRRASQPTNDHLLLSPIESDTQIEMHRNYLMKQSFSMQRQFEFQQELESLKVLNRPTKYTLSGGGLSEAHSYRQKRVQQYMKQIEAIRDRSSLDNPRKQTKLKKQDEAQLREQFMKIGPIHLKESLSQKQDDWYGQMLAKQMKDPGFLAKQSINIKRMRKENVRSGSSLSPKSNTRISTRYADQEKDVINMIVEKYCDTTKTGIERSGEIASNRRASIVNQDPNSSQLRLTSVLSKGSSHDAEIARKIEDKVNKQMSVKLAREEHLTPRGNQADYDNINTILGELDAQLAEKMKQMHEVESKSCARRLGQSIRNWLKESKLQRFVRDVLKVVKLNRIFEKFQRMQAARKWFSDYKKLTALTSPKRSQLSPHSLDAPKSKQVSASGTPNSNKRSFKPIPQNLISLNTKPKNNTTTISRKGTTEVLSRKVSSMKPQQQPSKFIQKKTVQIPKNSKGHPDKFSSPSKFQVNTISINFGSEEPQGQYFGDPPGLNSSEAIERGKTRIVKRPTAVIPVRQKTTSADQKELMKKKIQLFQKIKKEEKAKLLRESGTTQLSDNQKQHLKQLGKTILGIPSDEEMSSDDSDIYADSDRFIRKCCKKGRIYDHNKPEWEPNFEWVRNEVEIPGLRRKKTAGQSKIEISKRKIQELRRKQFFNFLADFFDKLEAGKMAQKVGKDFKYTEEEKEQWLKKYFMKYFMENTEPTVEMVRIKVNTTNAHEKRECSCSKGMYDEKTGDLIPPEALNKIRDKPDQYITVPIQRELATREMKDAQLGFSQGIQTKMDSDVVANELEDIISKKVKRANRNALNQDIKVAEMTSVSSPGLKGLSKQNLSTIHKESSTSVPRKDSMPLTKMTEESATLRLKVPKKSTDNERSSFSKPPNHRRNESFHLYNKSPTQSTLGVPDGNLQESKEKQHHSTIPEEEAMSSIARELLKNSVKNRLASQIMKMIEQFKHTQKEQAKGEDFSVAFPEYYKILQKYSDSRMFSEMSPKEARKLHKSYKLSESQLMRLAETTLVNSSTMELAPEEKGIVLGSRTSPASTRQESIPGISRRVVVPPSKRRVADDFGLTSDRKTVTKNLALKFDERPAVSNFDHQKTPFSRTKMGQKAATAATTQMTMTKAGDHSTNLLKLAQRYNKTAESVKFGHQFGPSEQNPHLVHSLEHGNYKLFGLSKNTVNRTNKFVSRQQNAIITHISQKVAHTVRQDSLPSSPMSSGIRKLVSLK